MRSIGYCSPRPRQFGIEGTKGHPHFPLDDGGPRAPLRAGPGPPTTVKG